MAAWFDKNHLYVLLAIGIIFTFVCLYYFRPVLKINTLTAIVVALLCTGIGLQRLQERLCIAHSESPFFYFAMVCAYHT